MARPRSTSADAIIDTAAQLFLERGFHNTSIDDVAEAVGISKPTVYSYVSSKQWLLDQSILRLMNDMSSDVVPWEPGSAEELTAQLETYVDKHIERATKVRVLYRILYSEETEISESVRDQWRAFAAEVTRHFVSLLALYRDAGRIRDDVDLHAVANLTIPTLVSLHRWYQPDGPVGPDALRRLFMQMLGGVIDL